MNAAQKIPRRDTGTGAIYRAVSNTALAATIAILAWTVRTVVTHGEAIAVLQTQETTTSRDIREIQSVGSVGLQTHMKDDDNRVATMKDEIRELRSWIVPMQSLPAKIDNLVEGQKRLEAAMAEQRAALASHMQNGNGVK